MTVKLKTTEASEGRLMHQDLDAVVGPHQGVITYTIHSVPIGTPFTAVLVLFDQVALVDSWEVDWAKLKPGAIIRP